MEYLAKDGLVMPLTLAWDSHTICKGYFTGILFFNLLGHYWIFSWDHNIDFNSAALQTDNSRDSCKEDHFYFCLPNPFFYHH